MPIDQRLSEAPLLAAELDYIRVPRDAWELMLVRMRQLGASTISIAVPWSWHAPTPETVDLTGTTHPQRDVTAFVQLCARVGLRLVLKPGPFVGAGLIGGGIPPWLIDRHGEVVALQADGTPWLDQQDGLPRVCPLHPTYLRYLRSWIAAFSEALRAFQMPHSSVIAVKICADSTQEQTQTGDRADPPFAADFNPYILNEWWPLWLISHFDPESNDPAIALRRLNDGWGTTYADLAAVELSIPSEQPNEAAVLRRYADLNRFGQAYHIQAHGLVARWLQEDGWPLEVIQQTRHAERHNLDVSSFGDYLVSAYWQAKATRSLQPSAPLLAGERNVENDFAFAAPFLGGSDGITVAGAVEPTDEVLDIAAYSAWGSAPVRSDGSVRACFWHARGPLTLLDAVGGDFHRSRIPADVAIGYSRSSELLASWQRSLAVSENNHMAQAQMLAERLVESSISFDIVDLDTFSFEALRGYPLLLLPAATVMSRATQEKLESLDGLMVVGEASSRYDENLVRYDAVQHELEARLPIEINGDQIETSVAAMGGQGRYGWADQPDVDVLVRHSQINEEHPLVYLWIANRRDQPYNGVVAYRAPDDSIEHVQVTVGPLRIAFLVLRSGEVLGASFGGDSTEGSWLVRGLQTSIVWSGGPAVVAPYDLHEAGEGQVFFVSSPVSGRLNLRRAEGWEGLSAYRLLLRGALLPIAFATENSHLILPYVAEDALGQSDGYLLCPTEEALPPRLRAYLDTLLRVRAALLQRCADALKSAAPALVEDARVLTTAAASFDSLVDQPYTPEEYSNAVASSERILQPALQRLARRLTLLRAALATGKSTADVARESNTLQDLLTALARAELVAS